MPRFCITSYKYYWEFLHKILVFFRLKWKFFELVINDFESLDIDADNMKVSGRYSNWLRTNDNFRIRKLFSRIEMNGN